MLLAAAPGMLSGFAQRSIPGTGMAFAAAETCFCNMAAVGCHGACVDMACAETANAGNIVSCASGQLPATLSGQGLVQQHGPLLGWVGLRGA